MREKLEAILKNETRVLALKLRAELDLTQAEMAEALHMSTRGYADIESGASACGSLTFALLLIRIPDPVDFLRGVKLEFDRLTEAEEVLL